MPKSAKIVAWTAGVLIVVPVVLIALIFVLANMDWGRRVLECATAQLSGGQVVLTGVSGHFPDDLRIARAEVRDAASLWLTADDVTLQWSATALAHKRLEVQLLRASQVQLLRLPSTEREERPEPFNLPMRVDVAQVDINRLDIGAPIAGTAASVSLQGNLHAASLEDAQVALTVNRLDAPGSYKINGRIDAAYLKAELDINEPQHGLLAGLAKLPELGALSIQASAEGPRNAEAIRFAVAAGSLRASGAGTVNVVDQRMDLDVMADAPSMAPRQDVSWNRVSLQAHVHGPFKGPDATGQVRIEGLNAGALTFSADVQGNSGSVGMHAVLDRLRIPGPKPELLQSAPVDLRAEVKLDDPLRPVTFALSHPLVSMQGNANTGGELDGALTINGPALAPFAAIAGLDIKGHSTLNANFTTQGPTTKVEIAGVVGVTGGKAPIPALIGDGTAQCRTRSS